ncbi:rhodanese-related sulfurtransferase [Bacillus tianshenii]|uniref:Rhodanese-related sulfurtransferase n=1 Tax=Sutcliffiella tianshenii TaxID=1463404 RepID=A0ABS2P525_9BACI|nr:hypothetical protein [Bacillus tianshenii]MBM7622064.1 rhodanese-related sulfurtransferase [Bacillus tianshenii]
MIWFLMIIISIIAFFIYLRYVPVQGVPCIASVFQDKDVKILDVRDYNQSYKSPVKNSINIPVAYLKRNYHELADSKIIVVASDSLEKNISIRFLKTKGINVLGYTFTNCPCKKQIRQTMA